MSSEERANDKAIRENPDPKIAALTRNTGSYVHEYDPLFTTMYVP
jgi:hypothetical protein